MTVAPQDGAGRCAERARPRLEARRSARARAQPFSLGGRSGCARCRRSCDGTRRVRRPPTVRSHGLRSAARQRRAGAAGAAWPEGARRPPRPAARARGCPDRWAARAATLRWARPRRAQHRCVKRSSPTRRQVPRQQLATRAERAVPAPERRRATPRGSPVAANLALYACSPAPQTFFRLGRRCPLLAGQPKPRADRHRRQAE